ncbi:MAG: permease-like cell division protein FtsX [Patescibacteria group bacterium]
MSHQFITFWRIIKAGMQNFARSLALATAAIAVMVITLTIVLFSAIANSTFTYTVQGLTDKIDISVYLKDEVSDSQRDKLVNNIKQLQNVKSVNYLTKEQALEVYKEDNKNDIDLLLAISQTDNPLPQTIRIKPVDPDKINEIKSFLDKEDIKALQSDETSYSGARQDAIDKIAKAAKFLRRAGLVGVVVFALVSMLIIFNTIRMLIFNRRDELTIMRLLGAGSWFIKGPFVVETILYGIVSAVVSVSLCNAVFAISANAFEASSLGLLDIGYASKYFADHFWWILLIQLAIGILIGAASSLIATRRYLKFKTTK